MNDWDGFGLRPSRGMSAYEPVEELAPVMADFLAVREAMAAEPLRGITTDGIVRPDVFDHDGPGRTDTAPIVDAANTLMAALDADQRRRLVFPLDSGEKRRWLNVHPNLLRHGLLLAELPGSTRKAAMAVMAASLSARGYQQARDIMRLNGLLIELTERADEFGEWPFFFSLFGEPSTDQPWGWQIDGHHLNLNCLVLADRIVLTPSFMGSEPCRVLAGPLAGTTVFDLEEQTGLDLIRSFDDTQRASAVLRPSIHPDDLPADLQDPIDGRMQVGAFRDNAILAYEGVRGDALTDAQRRLLERVVAAYVGWGRDDHTGVKMEEVVRHLDETHFAWMGADDDVGPFYYRVHSPVVLIEFDHHPGIVWDNAIPARNHVHSILRTPNGGDYGEDLLRRHHEQFDHADGIHRPHESGHRHH